MKIKDIPFEVTCHGGFAEFQTATGEWLRVRDLDGTYVVTRFDADQRLVASATEMTAKQLAALL